MTWSENDIFFYYLGLKYSDYPKKIWERIKKENRDFTSILDVGCGPGIFSLIAIEDNYKVQAVDINKNHLDALLNKSPKKENLTLIYSDWIDAAVEKADITICAYSLSGSISTQQGINKIIDNSKQAAYFISFVNPEKTDFLTAELFKKLSIAPKSYPSSNDNLEFLFNCSNDDVRIEKINYDFGIPYFDDIPSEKYIEFISKKTGIDDTELLKNHLENIVIERNGLRWLPNPKESLFITWKSRNEKVS